MIGTTVPHRSDRATKQPLQPLVRQIVHDYERLVVDTQGMGPLPGRIERPPSARGRRAPDVDRAPSNGHSSEYLVFTPPSLAIKRWPRPLYLPPQYSPACVTTLFAPPYLMGSEQEIETAADGSSSVVSYSAGHADDGSVDVMAMVHGLDSAAELYEDGWRVRKARGFLLAGVYSVSPTATETELIVTAQVEASGVSVMYHDVNALDTSAHLQLSASMNVLRIPDNTNESITASRLLHVHSSVLQTRIVSKDIDFAGALSLTVPISPGNILAVFLTVEGVVAVGDGEAIVGLLNASSDGTFTQGGAVRFPYVELRQC